MRRKPNPFFAPAREPRLLAALAALFCQALAPSGFAQAPAEAPTTPGEAPPGEAPADEAPAGEAAEEEAAEGAEEAGSEAPADLATEMAALKARLEELEKKQEAAQMDTFLAADLAAKEEQLELEALATEEPIDVAQPAFRLYGFMDMGIQRMFADAGSSTDASFNGNALTFAVGNINQYFDYTPHRDWRGLAEIRFTMAPHGNATIGGIDPLTGQINAASRVSTQQYDPHSTAGNAPMWGGYTVIERAWIQWQKYDALQIRIGHWFTPIGIWNVDHGSPTLIAATTPQIIQMMFAPIRQTGLQVLGSFFVSEWELGYRAWLSNGRNEIAVLDLNDDKAFGLRTFVRKEGGDFNLQVGATYHHGRVADRIAEGSPVDPFANINIYESFAYEENVFGADVSLDIGSFRSRTEAVAQLVEYEDGKRPLFFGIPGFYVADTWRWSVYNVMAYRLPWWGLEPFLATELLGGFGTDDGALVEIAPGLNIHVAPSVVLKFQSNTTHFFSFGDTPQVTPDFTSVVGRVALAY